MLCRLQKWRISRLPLILSKPFTSTSAAFITDESQTIIATSNSAVEETLYGVRNFGLHRFLGGNCFCETLAPRLNYDDIVQITAKLRLENPEFAVGFYRLLKSDHGFQHSTKCGIIVAHILAETRRITQLQQLIKETIAEEGECFKIV
ncbi:unnamed protein product [Amaranthus hypochondriacus]